GGQASVFVVNRQWPIWFATGSRILTNVNEPSLEAGIPVEIFPNPVQDYLTIRTVFSSQGTVRIRVINALGQVIRQVDSPFLSGNWTYELPMNAMPSGMYRIQLDTGKESATLNVVRQ
ncbi:MAG: T9SS type A sorting domain-containing protein, partial [Saprospiraceae bacterium]|nr:T9SS type A sorting domain-containing protein [Saprospiraceae bacterium]